MYNNQLYANGTQSVLKVTWRLFCETPLVIRNGLAIQYSEDKQPPKTRGRNLRFRWQASRDEEHQVAALSYGYRVVHSKNLQAYHVVPPSSIRGALRSWTINNLVAEALRDQFVAPTRKKEESDDDYKQRAEAYVVKVSEALAQEGNGYQLIASLFGLALETRQESDNDLSNAGRLTVQTTPFAHAHPQPIMANGTVADGLAGPVNAQRHMTVRNPLDRITHASKKGGLHHFLEFRRGETFAVTFSVRNPVAADLGLFYLWQRELNDGLLRIGALSNIGRGRVSIQQSTYELWQLRGQSLFPYFQLEATGNDDILTGLWQKYLLDPSHLSHFESGLNDHVQ